MTIIQKFLDLFKLPDTKNPPLPVHTVSTYTPNPKTEQYHKRERIKWENNLNISYKDVSIYDMKPFNLKQPFNYESFAYIALDGYNLDKAYEYLYTVTTLLKPFHKYFRSVISPTEIDTECIYPQNYPSSLIALTPYTSTKRNCKYPICLWLQHKGEHGCGYMYRLFFNQSGEFKKGDLSFTTKKSTESFQIQIRNNGVENYIRRIDKTLYVKPYGTTILYMDKQQEK